MTNKEIRYEQRELSRKLRKKTYEKNTSRAAAKAAHAYLYNQLKGISWNGDSNVYGVGYRTYEDKIKACLETI